MGGKINYCQQHLPKSGGSVVKSSFVSAAADQCQTESEVLENGLDVANMQAIQQQKIEELTLYINQFKKEMDAMKAAMLKNNSMKYHKTTLISSILLLFLNLEGLSKTLDFNTSEKVDTPTYRERVFVEFTGTNTIFGTTPKNNPLRFEGSVKYSRNFDFLSIKSVQISPLVGYGYFNYTFNNAQFKSQRNTLAYGLNVAVTLGRNKQFELGLQSILFNESVSTLSNNSTLRYNQNGYEFNIYFGPNLNMKSLGVCPFVLFGYTERTEYRYDTDRKSLNLKLGLEIKI